MRKSTNETVLKLEQMSFRAHARNLVRLTTENEGNEVQSVSRTIPEA